MRKWIIFAVVLGMLLAVLLYGSALAGTSEIPCGCGDTTSGWRYYYSGNRCHELECWHCGDPYTVEACNIIPATCTQSEHCSLCGEMFSDPLGHTPGDPATCTTPQICKVCKTELVAALGHMPDAEATCTEPQRCIDCNAILMEALGHTPGAEATCTTDQVCTVCNEVLVPAHHMPGAAATCTTDQTCTVCGVVVTTATDHHYTAKMTKPTCTEKGYTDYTCKVCGNRYTGSYTQARGHWYGLWTSDEGAAHSADCRRCGYTKTVDCAEGYNVTIAAEEDSVISVCPVCGKMNDLQLIALETPSIEAIDKNAIPRGELIVRGLPNPFGGALYALTAAYEYAGEIEPLNGRVSITLPLDLEVGIAFKVVRVDAATETEAEEVWTEVLFTYEDGKLTFETDTAGLFLLVPLE